MHRLRLFRVLVGISAIGGLSVAAACGLEDGGVLTSEPPEASADTFAPQDASDTSPIADVNQPKDVNQPDTTPPPSCGDAGACLSGFGPGWTPYLHIIGKVGCPVSDGGSVRADYLDLTKVTFDNAACTCGNCATDASCGNPLVTMGSNAKCNDLTDAALPPGDASCKDLGANLSNGSSSLSVTVQPASSVCSVAQTGNQGWDAAVASICSASCDYDLCTAPPALYERCQLALGVHACPGGYKQYLLDRPVSPASCTACTCTAGATCGGTLTAFNSADCTGSPEAVTQANAGCVDAGAANVRSMSFDASLQTTCKPSTSTPSLAPTAGELTLCCK